MIAIKNEALKIKISLKNVNPPVWRRVLVSARITLPEFHDVIQIVMGWTDSHLHQFLMGEDRYEVLDPEWEDSGGQDEQGVYLSNLFENEKSVVMYEYDFGDGWEHEIVLEKVVDRDLGDDQPKCLAGERSCPPEDCGGPWGYENLLKVISDPKHKEHQDMMEWLGDDFESESFDLEEVNDLLSA